MKRTLMFMAAAIMALGMSARRHIVISGNNVNLRGDAATSAPVVKKGQKGAILEIVSQKQGWYQARSAEGDGETVWVSASVSKPLEDWRYEAPSLTHMLVTLPDNELGYVRQSKFNGGENTEVWLITSNDPKFWDSTAPVKPVQLKNITEAVYNTGRMRTYENYYRGKCHGSYILVDEKSDDGGETYSKIETPVYIYPDVLEEGGIFIDGAYYFDQNNFN